MKVNKKVIVMIFTLLWSVVNLSAQTISDVKEKPLVYTASKSSGKYTVNDDGAYIRATYNGKTYLTSVTLRLEVNEDGNGTAFVKINSSENPYMNAKIGNYINLNTERLLDHLKIQIYLWFPDAQELILKARNGYTLVMFKK